MSLQVDSSAGDPNGGGSHTWPKQTSTSDAYLQLEDPIGDGVGVRTAQCDFWDTLF